MFFDLKNILKIKKIKKIGCRTNKLITPLTLLGGGRGKEEGGREGENEPSYFVPIHIMVYMSLEELMVCYTYNLGLLGFFHLCRVKAPQKRVFPK